MIKSKKQGLLIIISAPSGAGKGSSRYARHLRQGGGHTHQAPRLGPHHQGTHGRRAA